MPMTTTLRLPRGRQNGFTLVEIAIVLMIVSLLLAALIPTLSSQMEQKNRSETKKKLEEIKEALVGYAVVNGRLPCPASSSSNGIEAPAGGGVCTSAYNGFVPATTLGLSGLNPQGYIVDGWNNPIRYAVATNNSNGFTTAINLTLTPDLIVCSAASTDHINCPASTSLVSGGVPAIIYSIGPNGGSGGTSADEAENPNPNSANNDKIFVSHETSTDFDDLVIWLSPNAIFNRMVSAGKLP